MNKSNLFIILVLIPIFYLAGCAQKTDQMSQITESNQSFEDVLDALPPGILLEETRGLIPEGTILAEVYRPGIELTKASEGFRSRLYNDAAGYCTIGYGHLLKKNRCNGSEPYEFRNGITLSHGENLLISDMSWAQYTVMKSVFVSLTKGQYAALVDFVFNVGSGNFKKSSLLKVVNAKHFAKAPSQFRRYVKARGRTWPGLVTRRKGEIALFLDGTRLIPSETEKALPEIDIFEGES